MIDICYELTLMLPTNNPKDRVPEHLYLKKFKRNSLEEKSLTEDEDMRVMISVTKVTLIVCVLGLIIAMLHL